MDIRNVRNDYIILYNNPPFFYFKSEQSRFRSVFYLPIMAFFLTRGLIFCQVRLNSVAPVNRFLPIPCIPEKLNSRRIEYLKKQEKDTGIWQSEYSSFAGFRQRIFMTTVFIAVTTVFVAVGCRVHYV